MSGAAGAGSAWPPDERIAWPPDALIASLRGDLGGRASTLGLVLGSGLGGIAGALEDPWIREASEIPGYPLSTVAGHAGRLLLGRLGGADLWVAQGRAHLYEGYTPEEVTRPVRLLHALGVRVLVLTHAAGSLTREIAPGEVVAVSDVINLFFRPLHVAAGGARHRRPLIDPDLFRLAIETARERRVALRAGVLAGSSGPAYETAAEVAAWRRLGGHVASMSTVPEAIHARELDMRCLLFSLVTNFATGLSRSPLRHEDVVDRAGEAGERLARLLEALAGRLGGV